jgi:hypothetical protein
MATWGINSVIGSAGWGGPVTIPEGEVDLRNGDSEVAAHSILFIDGGYGTAGIDMIKEEYKGIIPETGEQASSYDLTVGSWWYKNSPDKWGGMPFFGASQSCLGERVLNYHTDIDAFETESIGWPDELFASVYAAYTGVIR